MNLRTANTHRKRKLKPFTRTRWGVTISMSPAIAKLLRKC
jgi:hypothetical protein